jgi:hypothetical protein
VAAGAQIDLRAPADLLPTAGVRGQLGATGRPVADVALAMVGDHGWEREVRTDAQGRFHFSDLPRDNAWLHWLAADRQAPRLVHVDLGTGESRDLGLVQLPDLGTLHLRYVDADGGAWRGMVPDVFMKDAWGFPVVPPWTVGETGTGGSLGDTVARAPVPFGRYTLRTDEPGLVPWERQIDLQTAEHHETVVLQIGVRMRLRFDRGRDAGRDPPPLDVALTAADGTSQAWQLHASRHDDGAWSLEPTLEHGRYTFVARAGERFFYQGAFVVGDDEALPTRLEFQPH